MHYNVDNSFAVWLNMDQDKAWDLSLTRLDKNQSVIETWESKSFGDYLTSQYYVDDNVL